MSNARRILDGLDARLEQDVELTLYGRAALHLGFDNAPEEFAWSKDVDAVLWLGQAEELAERTGFWDATSDQDAIERCMQIFATDPPQRGDAPEVAVAHG